MTTPSNPFTQPASRRTTLIGISVSLLAAVCYGFIPFFTLPLKDPTVAPPMADATILFYRFGFATIVLGAWMLIRRQSFKVSRSELVTLIYLAFISDGSALFLIDGYHYMSSGVATTIHFMYPVFTALIMMTFYREARRPSTLFAIAMAVAGVSVLSWNPTGTASLRGVIIVLISALCYALYLIRVNRSTRAARMDSTRLVFYVMLLGSLIFAAEALRQSSLQPITSAPQFSNLIALALICTVVTNVCLVIAVKCIGSTMTAVIGALEPLTAVLIGCLVMGEHFTPYIAIGIALILPAVLIIIYTRRR